MKQMFIFGLGYTAKRIAGALEEDGWQVGATGSDGNVDFSDRDAVVGALERASHVLSSVPPDRATGLDPVLNTYGRDFPRAWYGYLSSTGVYGDADGAWVDENSPTGTGRRSARSDADALWLELGARVFRLPGIYGPGLDPVLNTYGRDFPRAWYGYLSSTGVYGDADGAWVDENSPTGTGRRSARSDADALWLELGARVFRLPGIYGPGRSALDRVRGGGAHRLDPSDIGPDQVFSRVHVDDIAAGVVAAIHRGAPEGAYNLGDDLPAGHNAVIEEACRLLGMEPPPLQTMEEAGLSDMARGFYAENRRVANGKAKRVLDWQPRYPTYREGLSAIRVPA